MNSVATFLASHGLTVADLIPGTIAITYTALQIPSEWYPEYVVDYLHRCEHNEIFNNKSLLHMMDREFLESNIDVYNIVNAQHYVCCNEDSFGKGYFGVGINAMFGIPLNFAFESLAEADKGKEACLTDKRHPTFLRWRNRLRSFFSLEDDVEIPSVDWDSSEGRAYRDSLLLSPMAKRFAIARDIRRADTNHLIWTGLSAYLASELGRVCFDKSFKRLTPNEQRLNRYRYFSSALIVGVGFWMTCVKLRNFYFERRADDYSATIGPDYAAGGLEYYDKLIQRNQALRKILGEKGEKRFDEKGNVRNSIDNWLTNFNIPFFHRCLTEKRNFVAQICQNFDAMSFSELKDHFEKTEVHRQPFRSTLLNIRSHDWRSNEVKNLERTSGLLEFEKEVIKETEKKAGNCPD